MRETGCGIRGWLALMIIAAGLSGCLGLTPQNPQQAECLALFAVLDSSTEAADCRNGGYYRASDFPWLRSSRFWSAVGTQVAAEKRTFWLEQLERLDAESRASESQCLAPAPTADLERLATCRALLRPLALADSERLQGALQIPDDYSLLRRTVGLYPLAYPFVAWGATNAYDERRAWFQRDLKTFTAQGEWRALGPEPGSPLRTEEVAALLQQMADNPLTVPLPDDASLRKLAEHFAPVFVQEMGGDFDHMGTPLWQKARVIIDPTVATVYYYADHLLYQGKAHLRLNYVSWYPERGGEQTPWIEAGNLDGVNIGLILDGDGSLLAAEVMNNCGCYHSFFPGPRLGQPRPVSFGVDPLVPQALPILSVGEHFGLYLTSGWHQALRTAALPAPAEHYQLRPYAELEQLPAADGRRRSIFSATGDIPQSARIERFLFFSMGIDNVGAMRQRGRQPITLVGREHYDEPDLLERNFLPRQ